MKVSLPGRRKCVPGPCCRPRTPSRRTGSEPRSAGAMGGLRPRIRWGLQFKRMEAKHFLLIQLPLVWFSAFQN